MRDKKILCYNQIKHLRKDGTMDLIGLIDSIKLPVEIPLLLHPVTVHFAIAIPVIVMLLEIVNLFTKRKCVGVISTLLLLLATGVYFAAVMTGKADGSETAALLSAEGKAELNEHKMLGIYLLYGMGALFVLRLIIAAFEGILAKLFFIIVLAIFLGFMFRQGKDGGELVYTYGANVKAVSTMDDKVMKLEEELESCKTTLQQAQSSSSSLTSKSESSISSEASSKASSKKASSSQQSSTSEETTSSSQQSNTSEEANSSSQSSSPALIEKAKEALDQIKGVASSVISSAKTLQ